MRIQSSLFAINTLARMEKSLSRSLERLASGSRINHASDDPTGLSIANGLESQIRGLTQGIRNINDANAFIETADGAMSTQTSLLQRMRELAVKAATGTLSNSDRGYLNLEFQQLFAEFERLTAQTNFNGTN